MIALAGRLARYLVSVAALLLLLVAGTGGALAVPYAMWCTAPPDALRLKVDLPNTARAIRRNHELVIVAIGSSSTEGASASSSAHTYPARLAHELTLRWPRLRLRVINEGIGGETASEMLKRFESDVVAHKPQLVVWQAGSNSLLKHKKLDNYLATIRIGIQRLKTAKTDVILMDPQYAPVVVAQPAHLEMVTAMRTIANDLKVGLFQRFAVMRHWVSPGRTQMDDVISRDRLHMNDASYACIAKLLADSVTAVARRELSPAVTSTAK